MGKSKEKADKTRYFYKLKRQSEIKSTVFFIECLNNYLIHQKTNFLISS